MSYIGNIKKSLGVIQEFSTSHQVLLFCTLGNGICDGDANIGGACEFDGGDCCQPIIDNSGCADETCLCYDDWSLHFTLAGKIKFHRKFICLRFIYLKTFYQNLQLTKDHFMTIFWPYFCQLHLCTYLTKKFW